MKKIITSIPSSKRYLPILVAWFFIFFTGTSDASKKNIDLTKLTLEELMNIEITSV